MIPRQKGQTLVEQKFKKDPKELIIRELYDIVTPKSPNLILGTHILHLEYYIKYIYMYMSSYYNMVENSLFSF